MKKFFILAVAIVFVFVALCAITVIAQVSQVPTAREDLYTIQKGDTLYALEGNYSGRPAQWSRLMELNSFLNQPGRVWVDGIGRTIVLIRPGEQLRGLVELGIIPHLYPLDQLKVVAPPVPVATSPGTESDPWWASLLVILLVILWVLLTLALICVTVRAIMTRNPITAGPAMVPGGVTDQTVADRFQAAGGSNVRVRNVVRGRVYGAVHVRYGDGSSRRLLLTGQAGYRAMVSRNNGLWTEEYMLQGCGNDLRLSGARYIPGFGFRFVPEGVVEAATTTAQPIPPVPAPAPAPAPATAATAKPEPAVKPADADGEKEFTFRPATKGPNSRPNFIDSKGFESFEVTINGDRTIIRFS